LGEGRTEKSKIGGHSPEEKEKDVGGVESAGRVPELTTTRESSKTQQKKIY